jgi:diguanylate cyclase (GGDEF)-like protein/PAS domain S-box-containing protein
MVYSLRFIKTETGRNFGFLMLGAFIWVSMFTLETAAISLETKLAFINLEFLGITIIPLAWVLLVYSYTGRKLSRKSKTLFLIIPLITNIIIWTNPLHHWFMGNPYLTYDAAPFPVVYLDYQFWFYSIHAPIGYLYLLIAIIVLVRSIRNSAEIYRTQSRLLLFSILLPSITDVLYVLGYSPIKYYNYTTAIFSISGLILFRTLFKHQFLDILPLARDTIIDNLPDGIIVCDHKNRLVDINPTAMKTFDIKPEMIGQPISESNHELLKLIFSLFTSHNRQQDIRFGKDPERHFDLTIAPVISPKQNSIGWVATTREITERIRLFKQLEALSFTDDLTGILNSRNFLKLGQQEIDRGIRSGKLSVSVIMIDLDSFKTINDTYGHPVGNQVLVGFTKTIQEILRPYDLFGRLGGEEFGLLLIAVSQDEAWQIAERLRAAVENNPININNNEITITASFGLVSTQDVDPNHWEIHSLLNLADQALYQAKQTGRNRVMVYAPEHSSSA